MPYIRQNIRLRQTTFGRKFGFGKNHYSVHPYHAQQLYSCQAFMHESSKVRGRGRKTGKTEARRLMASKAAQRNKYLSVKLKQNLPRLSLS